MLVHICNCLKRLQDQLKALTSHKTIRLVLQSLTFYYITVGLYVLTSLFLYICVCVCVCVCVCECVYIYGVQEKNIHSKICRPMASSVKLDFLPVTFHFFTKPFH